MHEDVLAGLGGDEAVALVGVEPLHGSNSHVLVPPSTMLEVSITPGPWWPGGKGQARPAVAKQNVNLCQPTVAGAATVRHHTAHPSTPGWHARRLSQDRRAPALNDSFHAG